MVARVLVWLTAHVNMGLLTYRYGNSSWADWVIGPEQALPVIKYAWDAGINFWDTANVGSVGKSSVGASNTNGDVPPARSIPSQFIERYGLKHTGNKRLTPGFHLPLPTAAIRRGSARWQ